MLSRILRAINPFAAWLDYRRQRDLQLDRQRELDRIDKAEEREMFRQAVVSMSSMVEKAFDANRVQNETFARWLASFDSPTPPRVREYDEDVDNQRYIERHGQQAPRARVQPTLPPELHGLSQLEQFEVLLDRMGS